jgi:ABC-type nitrate/sulfonate/bicarbonate transport system substrate-binding protein
MIHFRKQFRFKVHFLTAITVIVYVAFFSAGCREKAVEEENTGNPETIRIGAFKGEYATLVWVAESEGLFRKHGLNAQVTGYESGVAAVEALMSGNEDIATAAEFVFVNKSFEYGSKIRVLGVIDLSDSFEIVARIDRGILSPADLRGKKIAFTGKTPSRYFTDRFFLYNKIDPRTIRFVDIPPLKLVEAITKGNVDAAVTFEPYVWKIKQKLAGNVYSWPVQSEQQFNFLLICGTDFAQKRTNAIKKMFRALTDAETIVRKDPARVIKILEKRLALDEHYLVEVWNKNAIGLSLDQSLFLAMEVQARWAIANGFAPSGKQPDYIQSIYWEPLASVRPDAVTLYK